MYCYYETILYDYIIYNNFSFDCNDWIYLYTDRDRCKRKNLVELPNNVLKYISRSMPDLMPDRGLQDFERF